MTAEGRSEALEALALGRRNFELFNAGDMDGFWSLQHPECLMVTDPAWLGGGEYRGKRAYRLFISQFLEAFAEIRWVEDDEPELIGSRALFRGHWAAVGASSGIESATPAFCVVFGARDGMVAEVVFSFSRRDARRFAAGEPGDRG